MNHRYYRIIAGSGWQNGEKRAWSSGNAHGMRDDHAGACGFLRPVELGHVSNVRKR